MKRRQTSFWIGLALLTATLIGGVANPAFSAPFTYVADSFNNWVAVIDLATDEIATTIPVDAAPQNIILNNQGTLAFVTNYTSNTVSIIDVGTVDISNPGTETVDTVNDPGGVILNPEGIAISPDGSKLYLAHAIVPNNPVFEYSWYTHLSEIQYGDIDGDGTDTWEITRSHPFLINEAVNPYALEVSPDGSKIYISGRIRNSVFVIDANSMTNIREVSLGDNSEAIEPRGMAITSDGSKVFVANKEAGTVSVIHGTNYSILATVNVGNGPYDVAVSADDAYAYVVNSSDATVSIININNNYSVSAPIDVGSNDPAHAASPRAIAFNTIGDYAYVTGYGDNSVTIIDTALQTVHRALNLDDGEAPYGGMLGITAIPDPYPSIKVSPMAIPFGSITVDGVGRTEMLNVTNEGLATLSISSIDDTNLGAGFSISNNGCTGADLEYNGAPCTISVTFNPTAGGPALFGSFDILSNTDTVTVNVSGTGVVNTVGNSAPTAPILISATAGTTSVDLAWESSTDRDNDALIYHIEYSTDATFQTGVITLTVNAAGTILAGSGLAALFLLGGALRMRNRKAILLASLLAVSVLLTACGGGGGGGGGAATTTVSASIPSGLTPNTVYFWRVIADDQNGGVSTSAIRSFRTE